MDAKVTSQGTRVESRDAGPTGTPSQYMWLAMQGVTLGSQVLRDHDTHTTSNLGKAEAARVFPMSGKIWIGVSLSLGT